MEKETFRYRIQRRPSGVWVTRSIGIVEIPVNSPAGPHFPVHSPDGPEYGYAGSGPAQLALNIMADYLQDGAYAVRVYQEFKRKFIEPLAQNVDQHFIETVDIDAWLESLGDQYAPAR